MANEANPFQVGDVVILKSGGPNMTVQSTSSTHTNCIYWVSEKQNFYDHNFNFQLLDKVDFE